MWPAKVWANEKRNPDNAALVWRKVVYFVIVYIKTMINTKLPTGTDSTTSRERQVHVGARTIVTRSNAADSTAERPLETEPHVDTSRRETRFGIRFRDFEVLKQSYWNLLVQGNGNN